MGIEEDLREDYEFKDWIPLVGRINWISKRDRIEETTGKIIYGAVNNLFHISIIAYGIYKLFLEK